MASSAWIHRLAAISGASAVVAGAYGAHKLKPSKDPAMFNEVFDRGSRYHLIHSLLLAAAPITKRPALVAGMSFAGMFLFSGSCYAVAILEDRSKGRLAPIGGFLMIGAWLALF